MTTPGAFSSGLIGELEDLGWGIGTEIDVEGSPTGKFTLALTEDELADLVCELTAFDAALAGTRRDSGTATDGTDTIHVTIDPSPDTLAHALAQAALAYDAAELPDCPPAGQRLIVAGLLHHSSEERQVAFLQLAHTCRGILSAPGPIGSPLAPSTPVSDTLARLLRDVVARDGGFLSPHLLIDHGHLVETARALCGEQRTITMTRGASVPGVTR